MAAHDAYFTDLGRETENSLYRPSIRAMYGCIRTGTRLSVPQILNTAGYARTENQGRAMPFLARECGFGLIEVSDLYIAATRARAKFLGFRLSDDLNVQESQAYVPHADDLGMASRLRLKESIANHPEAGAGTLLEVAPDFLGINSPNFISKEKIWLNQEQRDYKADLQLMQHNIDARVLRGVEQIQATLQSRFMRTFRRAKILEYAGILEELRAISIRRMDVLSEAESMIYLEAMGKPNDVRRDNELAQNYINLQLLLSEVETRLGE